MSDFRWFWVQFITIYNKISEISTLVTGKYFSWKSKMTDLKLYISLTEIGGYTSPDIFVKKKSKNFDNFFSWPQTSVFVFFPWCWHDYFHYFLCKILKSQKNRLINSYRARVEMDSEEHFRENTVGYHENTRISWKYMYFTTGFPIQMKIFPKMHFVKFSERIDRPQNLKI